MFFENLNEIDKFLPREKRVIKISKIIKEKGNIVTDTIEIQWVTRSYYKQLHTKKMVSLQEIFLEICNLQHTTYQD